jgi:hypothetical protein
MYLCEDKCICQRWPLIGPSEPGTLGAVYHHRGECWLRGSTKQRQQQQAENRGCVKATTSFINWWISRWISACWFSMSISDCTIACVRISCQSHVMEPLFTRKTDQCSILKTMGTCSAGLNASEVACNGFYELLNISKNPSNTSHKCNAHYCCYITFVLYVISTECSYHVVP